MPLVNLQHVVSFTSEDPKHKAENLVNGSGIWLCKSNDLTGTIKAEFQLKKASSINYIDIGNCNSAMICVEVGMSSWPISQDFVTLLPTVVLMTPADCRGGQNAKCVKMFKKENLDKQNASKKWDRVRVICSQPFMRNTQYGLAFFKLYAFEETSHENIEVWNCTDFKKKEFFQSSLPSKSPLTNKMTESLLSLENGRLNSSESSSFSSASPAINKITSPISRAGRLVLARKHVPNEVDGIVEKKQLECEALSFLISMNLTSKDIHSLKVSHIREEFEVRRKKSLNTREKSIFKNIALDYAAERLNKIENEEKGKDVDLITLLSDDEAENEAKSMKTSNKFSFKRLPGPPLSNKTAKIRKEDPLLSPCDVVCKSRNDVSLADAIVAGSTTTSVKEKKRSRIDDSGGKSFKSRRTGNGSPAFNSDDDVIFDLGTPSPEKVSFHEGKQTLEKKNPEENFDTLPASSDKEPSSNLDRVECPICTDLFSTQAIEEHAASCDGGGYTSVNENSQFRTNTPQELDGECPICGKDLPQSKLQEHAEDCADRTFS